MLPLLQGLSFCHPYFRPITNVTIILYSYYLYYYYYYSFVLLLCNVCLLIMLMFMFIPSNFSLIFFCFKQINYLIRTTWSLCGNLFECNYLPLPKFGIDDGLMMTLDLVLKPTGSWGYRWVHCRITLACTATTEIVRKKRTSGATFRPPCRPTCSLISKILVGLMNRR